MNGVAHRATMLEGPFPSISGSKVTFTSWEWCTALSKTTGSKRKRAGLWNTVTESSHEEFMKR